MIKILTAREVAKAIKDSLEMKSGMVYTLPNSSHATGDEPMMIVFDNIAEVTEDIMTRLGLA